MMRNFADHPIKMMVGSHELRLRQTADRTGEPARHETYGSESGPKSGGGMRCFVAASYADAMRRSNGSEKGRPKNITPTGSFAGIGPTSREPSAAAESRTRSYT